METLSNSEFPPLTHKRERTPSPSKATPDKAPRTCQNSLQQPDQQYIKASFLLRATNGARVFNNPSKVSHALLHSSLGKYILGGETRCLGNGSALIVAVWEHILPKVPVLRESTFQLGDWEVSCRRAESDSGNYQYARVGPLDDAADLTDIQHHFKTLDGGDVVELAWIPAHHLPRTITGKWIRLKVRGTLPSRVSIHQLVFWPRPYLLPLLRCPGCQKIGHSINTCRSAVRCSRCSGPHSHKQGNTICSRPYRCFQCGGAHGPRSVHCPHNRHAQQVYADMAQDNQPLHAINKQLRSIATPKSRTPQQQQTPPTSTPRGPQQAPPAPTPTPPNQLPIGSEQTGMPAASITTTNKFSPFQDPLDDDAIILEDADATPAPSGPAHPQHHRHRPRRRMQGYQAPPPTPSPLLPEEGITHHTVEAEVHQPHVPPTCQGQKPVQFSGQATFPHSSHTMSTGHPSPPSYSTSTSLDPSSAQTEVVLSRVFSLLWKGYQLYQTGTSMPEILATLWPTLSSLLTSLFP